MYKYKKIACVWYNRWYGRYIQLQGNQLFHVNAFLLGMAILKHNLKLVFVYNSNKQKETDKVVTISLAIEESYNQNNTTTVIHLCELGI